MKATVFDNRTGNPVEELHGATPGSLFRSAQYLYGHCLGRVVDQAGSRVGWRFAKCHGDVKCAQTDIVDIILDAPPTPKQE